MGYHLGVDLGTTFVAAAIANESRVEMFTLGDRTVVTPAVIFLGDDGNLVSGDAAGRRAVSSPDRIGREFKRRLGDPTPVMLGGTSYAVTTLLGTLLHDVVNRVTETEGVKPDSVVLTHPANWGPFRRELFEEVPQVAGLTGTRMVTEPEAAAAHYAASRHLADGEIIAVYDLGGGTFDATVLRKTREGIEILGAPEGIERLGGVDFDEAILSYVNYSSGGALSELDMSDPQTAIAMARLRQDCVLAKESLSIDTETTIPVFLPSRHFDVQLNRPDFEDMIRAPVESTIGTLIRTLRSAHVDPNQLSAVLLVGGSSRIPLVARMISEELGRPTVVDAHPKYAVALGAATLARAGGGTLSSSYQGPASAEVPARSADPASALGVTERGLAEVLGEVLGVLGVSIEANFFDDLGADSMLMARFCARLRERPELPSVTMKDVYQYPTIKLLSAAFASAPAPAAVGGTVVLRPGAQAMTAPRAATASAPAPAPASASASAPVPMRPAPSRRAASAGPGDTRWQWWRLWRVSSPVQRAAIPSAGVAVLASQPRDLVECAVYAPRCVSRGETFLVQVFAYLAPDTQAVDDLARAFDTRARRRAYTCLDLAVRHGQRLTFHVMAEGCSIDQPVRHVVWAGRTAPMQFAMHIDPRFARNAIIGKVSICLDGVPVGHLVFTLAIRVTGNDGRQADVSARVYRQVFISYASADRAEVIKRVQMLSTLRINYFQDILHLDPGDRWEQKLYRHIDQADLFLLFWSSAARNSKWVRKEIRYALDRKGPRDSPPEIVPVVIEGPPPPAPWPELENLHLTDRLLYLMSGA